MTGWMIVAGFQLMNNNQIFCHKKVTKKETEG
jgi:hypothetical protein